METLKRLLEYTESRIDPAHYAAVEARLKACARFEALDRIPLRVGAPVADFPFRGYSMEEIHADMTKMMTNELISAARLTHLADDSLPMLRANFGVGILPSVFGCGSRILNGNMPWVEHLPEEEIPRLIERGVPDYKSGFGARIIETYEFYKDMLAPYPNCRRAIKLYHPDYQGPFDVAHLIWGSDIYYALYDAPEPVHALLNLVTDTYIAHMRRVKAVIDDVTGDGFVYHWNTLFPGGIVLRNDTAVNLSLEMYEEFVRPYDERLAAEFGGASMHYCGRADHWIASMAESKGISGFNFGRVPNLVYGNDFLGVTKPIMTDKKRSIHSYSVTADEWEAVDKAAYRTGISFTMGARSRDAALALLESAAVK